MSKATAERAMRKTERRDYLTARGWTRVGGSGSGAQVWRSPDPADRRTYDLAGAMTAAADLELGGGTRALPQGHGEGQGQEDGRDALDERAEAAGWVERTGYACPCCGSPAGIAGSALTGTQRITVEHVGACPRGRLFWPLRSRPQWTVGGTGTQETEGHTTAAPAA